MFLNLILGRGNGSEWADKAGFAQTALHNVKYTQLSHDLLTLARWARRGGIAVVEGEEMGGLFNEGVAEGGWF
jgi:hypothetical protein